MYWKRWRARTAAFMLTALLSLPSATAKETESTAMEPKPEPRGADPFQLRDSLHARNKRRKLGLAVGFGSVGLATAGAGFAIEYSMGLDYGRALWITGLGSVTGGLALYLIPSPIQILRWKTKDSSDVDLLQEEWARLARSARISRTINGVMFSTMGGAALVFGTLFAMDAISASDGAKTALVPTLFMGGGAFLANGLISFIVPMDIEWGYDAAFGENAPKKLSIHTGLIALPQGGGWGLQGEF